ncbi:alpha/beta hydrolase-fold protein [uncultured Eudoraea sp.]|uniref:alpha/beta hydrolase n=1 Tax=uncultured Eudoraea sp. TaxID=1035614 RepID=UPI0026349D68|nr:alpha/beta hydrolase-fold protein [uncultured Eudoraea sp.]
MFRTIEKSNPAFESNHLSFITVKSRNLKGRGDICLFVPPLEGLKDIPLVILLHGVYGSAWVWSQKAGVHISTWEMIQKDELKPMAIAMPSDGLWGDGSGYLPHSDYDFEKWIVDDVTSAVMENVASVSENSELFISGLSMGGFGALRLGIKYSDKFKAVSAHSSITEMEQMSLFVEEPLTAYEQNNKREESVLELALDRKEHLPELRFDCGTEDLLINQNRLLHKELNKAQIAHVYEEFNGGHEWDYWQKHIKDSLRFFNKFIK